MASTIIIGDGPGGLSAALFLGKNDHPVTLFGTDGTAMHWAHLYNYLGVPDIGGSAFQQTARAQVAAQGVTIDAVEVTAVALDGEAFTVTADGTEHRADYLVLAGGKSAGPLADALGLEVGADGVETDRDGRSAVDRVYVVGRLAKPNRSQAIISAGMGAAAALDILSREAGTDVTDWDSPPKE
ncbi:NAD(P)/FAD-dependent oxidoreductase [soil metagenome]